MDDVRVEGHRNFWNHKKNPPILASFHLGDYFFATHYLAAEKLLAKGTRISPGMIDVDSFMEDYERQFNEVSGLGQGGFWTAEPYTGIPWMEAFWGCEIIGNGESITSRPLVKNAGDLEKLQFTMENPWVGKYLEFVDKLNSLSQGRFPVGAPIMRGQGDTLGALLGQTELIYALYEEPDPIRKALGKIAGSFLEIYAEMHRRNLPFHGGSSLGFYHLWAPGESLWFQDDFGALLSPALYRDFFLENERYLCGNYQYNMMHLHPSSFHLLDVILDNENLKAVEVNKDVGGPSVRLMLPWYRKVLDSNRGLVIWGDLNEGELQLILESMPLEGVFFSLVQGDAVSAKKIISFLEGAYVRATAQATARDP